MQDKSVELTPSNITHMVMAEEKEDDVPVADLTSFLSGVPPHQIRRLTAAWEKEYAGPGYWRKVLVLPAIRLYCDGDECLGDRYFDPIEARIHLNDEPVVEDHFCNFACRNCKENHKTIALKIQADKEESGALAVKIGELPRFGPPLASKLRKFAGDYVDLLDKGYRAERDGLGIAAFAYYRRVVEGVKVKLIGDIIKASKALNASSDVIKDLEKAKAETRFTQAVEAVKHGIPQALFINGHSPLTLLHDALSDHLHGKSDEECLQLATIVRVILAELFEKLSAVFADKKEVEGALNKLLQMRAAREKK